ncbi:MAG: hypothetical protein M3R20_03775 [Pseudomonadota bacterium]|nr:hypothetical protein [Pseudomonadota bacterium]
MREPRDRFSRPSRAPQSQQEWQQRYKQSALQRIAAIHGLGPQKASAQDNIGV